MKKFTFKSALTALIAALTFIGSAPCSAEEFSDNPNLYGTWVLESMQFGGEKLIQCRSNGYTQIKYYGKDGEYACVQFNTINDNDGISDLHLAVGDGTIEWDSFAKLRELYFKDASVLIETSSIESQRRSLEYLKNIIEF